MKKLTGSIVAGLALLALGAPRVEATPLAPGGTVVAATVATGFGGVELDSIFHDDVAVTSATGSLRYTVDMSSAVYRSPTGTLDFYYQVTSLAGGLDDIRRLTMIDFTGFLTDVYQILSGSTVGCTACPGGSFLDGSQGATATDRDGSGAVVGWDFGPVGPTRVQPGETTLLFVIRTDATHYVPGSMSVIDGATTDREAFAPAVVPEPASLTLLGLGFLTTGFVARRRLQQQKAV